MNSDNEAADEGGGTDFGMASYSSMNGRKRHWRCTELCTSNLFDKLNLRFQIAISAISLMKIKAGLAGNPFA